MSEPKEISKPSLHDAMTEIIHAMSALNMYPTPMPGVKEGYLSETDFYANHAMEHLQAAIAHIHSLQRQEKVEYEYQKALLERE